MKYVLGALSYVVFVVALPFLLLHPKIRRGFSRRLGIYRSGWPGVGDGPRIWVHGASAGDMLALKPTVEALKSSHPNVRVIATTITNSGDVIARKLGPLFDANTFLPYDLPHVVRRALDRIRPDVLVLEYTELWPQLIHAAHQRGVPIVLHNGRLSAENIPSYKRMFFFTGNLVQAFAMLLMRSDAEAERVSQLGADATKVHVTGNTKFDNLDPEPKPQTVEALRVACGLVDAERVWVAGSTHEREEERLLEVFKELRAHHPTLRMVIAPRYIERSSKILAATRRAGFTTRLRSKGEDPVDVVVLDTIGELAACYSLADVVFVGGSFVKRGGQNIMEPAVCGKPVVFGPYMRNFAESVQLLLGRGGMQVSTPGQLTRVLDELLRDPEQMDELGNLARNRVLELRGAAAKNAAYLGDLLAGGDGRRG